jgi:hypothetical protein
MTNNMLTEMCDLLFKMGESLSEAETEDAALLLIKKSHALVGVVQGMVNIKKLTLDAYRTAAQFNNAEVIGAVTGTQTQTEPQPQRLEGAVAKKKVEEIVEEEDEEDEEDDDDEEEALIPVDRFIDPAYFRRDD